MNTNSNNLILQLTARRKISDEELSERIQRTMLRVLRHDKPASGLRHDGFAFFKLQEFLEYVDDKVSYLRDGVAERLLSNLEALIAAEKVEIRSGKVRALYGHSLRRIIVGQLKWPEQPLLHATLHRRLKHIFQQGLRCQSRTWVHLTTSREYADSLLKSQKGDGPTVLLSMNPTLIENEAVCFRQPNSHVWLANFVPPKAISVVQCQFSKQRNHHPMTSKHKTLD